MFSPLSNKKASDKTWKSSLRDVFEADGVCYDKTISASFPIIKRNVDAILQKETVQFVCFLIRKIPERLMRRSFCYLYIQLKVAKVCGIKLTISVFSSRSIDVLKLYWRRRNSSFASIFKEVTIYPVCCWWIFKLSLSLMDFISSNSERLTAVPKFHKLFYLFFFKDFV